MALRWHFSSDGAPSIREWHTQRVSAVDTFATRRVVDSRSTQRNRGGPAPPGGRKGVLLHFSASLPRGGSWHAMRAAPDTPSRLRGLGSRGARGLGPASSCSRCSRPLC